MSSLDYLVIAGYAGLVLAIGIRARRTGAPAADLHVASRSLPTWAVLCSLVATELSAATFIGVPAAGYGGDWAFLQLAFGALLGKLVLSVTAIPLYHRLEVLTVYGALERRFGPITRKTAASCFVAGRLLASGVRLFIAALAFSVVTGQPIAGAILLCGLLAGSYTLVGGIRSVIWTDVLQGAVFLLAALASLVALHSIVDGGVPEIFRWALENGRARIFHLDPLLSLGDSRPFLVGLVGGCFLTLATHGTDHDMVQRLLTTRDGRSGGRALWLSALVNFPLTLVFLFIGTGLAAAYLTPPAYDISDSNRIFAHFALHELPSGLRGLFFAGLFAAAMSSFDSAVCAIASTVSVDLMRPAADDASAARRMRVLSGVCCVALVAAALVMAAYHAALSESGSAGGTSLVEVALSAMTILYGGLLGVFALGFLSRSRGSDRSAVCGLLSGALVGVALFVHPIALGRIVIAWTWWIPISGSVALGIAALSKRRKTAETSLAQ